MQSDAASLNVIISGGGTGGHLFPGIAIAQEFMRTLPSTNIVFIGSTSGIESRILPQAGFHLETTAARGFLGKSPAQKAAALTLLGGACIKAALLLKKHKADIVIGLGGYISFPALLAGTMLGIPTVIHEQNSIPGLSNKILGRIAKRICISFRECARYFPENKTVYSGLPVRNEFFTSRPPAHSDTLFRIVVCGGSQGSQQINAAVLEALPLLGSIRNRLQFIHQSGDAMCSEVRRRYAELGFQADVRPFIENMYGCLCGAGLVIARAGASTLAELAVCGKASILIPFPHATENHQEHNARSCVESGAARMIRSDDLCGETLASMLLELEGDRSTLRSMELRSAGRAAPDAAKKIMRECCRVAAQAARRHTC